jgi:glycosyltransferase involved in cell wall biosynthesis
MERKTNPFVSVIIPVYNDSEMLKTCLKALNNQTYPKNRYEVIIVDNGSDENIKKIINNFSSVVITKENYPSLHAARNKGISIAKGEVLAFTDADCIPSKDWIEKGVKRILSLPNCGLVAGKIRLFFKNPKKKTAAELFEKISAFPQKEYIKKWKFGATANVFTTKKIIDDIGVLDGTLKSGADFEWGKRIFAAKYKLIYANDVCVAHPARYSLSQIYKKYRRITGGNYDLTMKKGYPLKKFTADLIRELVRLKDFSNIFLDKRLNGVNQRIKVFIVMLIVKYAKISERIRLRLGGESKRI